MTKETLLNQDFNRGFFEYLTKKEREIIEKLGKTAYVRQQAKGKKIRDKHIQRLEAQIGALDFQPLDVNSFSIDAVLRKYGFILKLVNNRT